MPPKETGSSVELHQIHGAGAWLVGGTSSSFCDWNASTSPSSTRTHNANCAAKSSVAFAITPPSAPVPSHVLYEAAQEAGLRPQKETTGLLQPRPDSNELPQRVSHHQLTDVWILHGKDMIPEAWDFRRYLLPSPSCTKPRLHDILNTKPHGIYDTNGRNI